jgi:hypothetical protein
MSPEERDKAFLNVKCRPDPKKLPPDAMYDAIRESGSWVVPSS